MVPLCQNQYALIHWLIYAYTQSNSVTDMNDYFTLGMSLIQTVHIRKAYRTYCNESQQKRSDTRIPAMVSFNLFVCFNVCLCLFASLSTTMELRNRGRNPFFIRIVPRDLSVTKVP